MANNDVSYWGVFELRDVFSLKERWPFESAGDLECSICLWFSVKDSIVFEDTVNNSTVKASEPSKTSG